MGARRDEDGVMTLTDIAPGEYRVLVSSTGFSVDERHIEVKPNETVSLESVLYEAGAARIVVQDAQGEFMPNLRVEITPDDKASIEEPRNGTTSRGGLVMARGLSPGGYTIKVHAPTGSVREEKIRIRPREVTDWLVVLK